MFLIENNISKMRLFDTCSQNYCVRQSVNITGWFIKKQLENEKWIILIKKNYICGIHFKIFKIFISREMSASAVSSFARL